MGTIVRVVGPGRVLNSGREWFLSCRPVMRSVGAPHEMPMRDCCSRGRVDRGNLMIARQAAVTDEHGTSWRVVVRRMDVYDGPIWLGHRLVRHALSVIKWALLGRFLPSGT